MGLGWGYNVGAEVTDHMIVLTSTEAVLSFMTIGQLSLGAEVDLALGPLGRSAAGGLSLSEKVIVFSL